jgi:hypothetical protein
MLLVNVYQALYLIAASPVLVRLDLLVGSRESLSFNKKVCYSTALYNGEKLWGTHSVHVYFHVDSNRYTCSATASVV